MPFVARGKKRAAICRVDDGAVYDGCSSKETVAHWNHKASFHFRGNSEERTN